jgi:hypothetical protein
MENSADIGEQVAREKIAAEHAAKVKRWEEMSPREQLVDRARLARRTAFSELRDFECPDNFHHHMKRARAYLAEARTAPHHDEPKESNA